jgi:hypothetical protein
MSGDLCMAGDIEQAVVDYAIGHVPGWVQNVGYTKTAFRVPHAGEYFYDPFSDRILRADIPEEKPYVILDYSGSE